MATSAGLLLYRRGADGLEVLLVHPGGPFFARKDAGAWSLPKGLVDAGEDPLAAARRELEEETGLAAPDGDCLELGEVMQKGKKRVLAWAVAGQGEPDASRSNTFEIEWPPRSGRRRTFPEVDRAEWMPLERAREAILPAQVPFLERLVERVGPV